MKINLRAKFLIVFIGLTLGGWAQNQNTYCIFDSILSSRNMYLTEQKIQNYIFNKRVASSESSHNNIKIIPVVVHVIHNGGNENISDIQIQNQIQILNEDYGKLFGSNGFGSGVDTKVKFCLAKLNPQGKCTNGIIRIKSPLTNHQSYQRALLKELSFWDNTKYLNIYVVKNINGNVGGYSSFPGGPPEEDGIVVRHNLFGNSGTASNSLGRTTTHELGHWFGLYHVFNNGCGTDTCTDGDYVCDTPPASSPHFSCTAVNSCSNDFPDVNDQIKNYLDYTPDACKNMFTEGQKERIHATLDTIRTVIWSSSNLLSTGCDSNYVSPINCPVVADFVTLNKDICIGNSVYFIDKSMNSPSNWRWTFIDGIPSTSTSQNPTIKYNNAGSFPVKLVVFDTTSADSIEIINYITVSPPGIGDPLSFGENFDSGLYPPQSVSINNADGGITWELDSNASLSGKYSIKINNLINTNYGSTDEIEMPYLDISSIHPDSNIYMSFNWAYAKSDPTFSDELLVLASADCGNNFNQIFYRTQSNLATGPTQTSPFIPDSTQWKKAYINLGAFRNNTYLLLKIVNVTDGGNNLYIDNIYVGDGSDPINSISEMTNFLLNVSLFPNPSKGNSTLKYTMTKASEITVSLFDLQGQHVETLYEGKQNEGIHRLNIEAENRKPGMYYITIETESGNQAIKFLTQ